MKKLLVIGLALVVITGCFPKQFKYEQVKESVVFIKQMNDEWSATGFIVNSEGIVITARHVVEGQEEVKVRLCDGTWLEGLVIFEGNDIDIGIIQLPLGDYKSLKLAEKDPNMGEPLWTVGIPLGDENGYIFGFGSVCGWSDVPFFGKGKFLLSDIHIQPGHSGSPVFNKDGEVCGIVVGYGNHNLAFFLSIESMQRPLSFLEIK